MFDNPKPIYNCITRIKKRTTKRYYKTNELHFSESEHKLRRRVLECVLKNDIKISYLLINKKDFVKHLIASNYLDKAGDLKDALFLSLISKTVHHLEIRGNPNIIIDRYLSTDRLDKFNQTFNNFITGKNYKIKKGLTPEHKASYENKGLQAVDFIAGAIHQNYRDKKSNLYSLLRPKIECIFTLTNKK